MILIATICGLLMMGSIPPLKDVFKSAGMELPNYLKGTPVQEGKTADGSTLKKGDSNVN